jgi:hypothetical protein
MEERTGEEQTVGPWLYGKTLLWVTSTHASLACQYHKLQGSEKLTHFFLLAEE